MGQRAVRRFLSKAEQIRLRFPRPIDPARWLDAQPHLVSDAAAYCIIDLNDLWGGFCRELTFDFACGRAMMADGTKSVPFGGAATVQNAMTAVCNKRGYEPRWHAASETAKALQTFPSRETSAVVAAISSKTSPAPDLNTTRNYFAHRRSECRQKLEAASFYDAKMNYSAFAIGNYLRADGRSLIDFWIDELNLIATACT